MIPYYPNARIAILRQVESSEKTSYGDNKLEWVRIASTEADIQKLSDLEHRDKYGSESEDTYRIFLPVEVDVRHGDKIIVEEAYSTGQAIDMPKRILRVVGNPRIGNIIRYKRVTAREHTQEKL